MKDAHNKPGISKKSVSFPEDLYAAAEKRAVAQNRTFSNYLQTLVQADLTAAETAASAKAEDA